MPKEMSPYGVEFSCKKNLSVTRRKMKYQDGAITADWMCVFQLRIILWNRICICGVYSSPT